MKDDKRNPPPRNPRPDEDKKPYQPQPGRLPEQPELEEEGGPETQTDGAGKLDIFYDDGGNVVMDGDARQSR